MAEARKYTVRPHKPAKTETKGWFRVYLSDHALIHAGFEPGTLCEVSNATDPSFLAVVWLATGIQDSIVQTTETLRELYDFKLGDHLCISPTSKTIQEAEVIVLSEHRDPDQKSSLEYLQPSDASYWAWLLKYKLQQTDVICPGLVFTVRAVGEERAFKIEAINASTDKTLYQTHDISTVTVAPNEVFDLNSRPVKPAQLDTAAVSGLKDQMSRLNLEIAEFCSAHPPHPGIDQPDLRTTGIILHGLPGTGKTMLLDMVAKAGWRKVFTKQDIRKAINHARPGGRDPALHSIFKDAQSNQPSLIVMDDCDEIIGGRERTDFGDGLQLARCFFEWFHTRGNDRILVLAAIRDLSLIHESLRGHGRFDTEIEMPVPGTAVRREILRRAAGLPTDSDAYLYSKHIAQRTHGYVGADLVQLVKVALKNAKDRIGKDDGVLVFAGESDASLRAARQLSEETLTLAELTTKEDCVAAMRTIRPTAMKEIILDPPTVYWSDIGGQEEAKTALRKVIDWPRQHLSQMVRLGFPHEKGILLYGPPGCSKTLVAKAVATEANLSFIAVKGPDMMNMYVGESERNIREIFRKAQAVSPSVIFFDEIDSIASDRKNSSHNGLNVVATLLNELDGIEELERVFVLAATNRPEIIDPALLRSGRIGGSLYMGLPDEQTRLEIFTIKFRKMDVDPDVQPGHLAIESDGHTGAECVRICERAAEAALEEQIETGIMQVVSRRHWDIGLQEVERGVSNEMLLNYDEWAKKKKQQHAQPVLK